MQKRHRIAAGLLALGAGSLFAGPALAADCPVNYEQLAKALRSSVKPAGGPSNGGFDNNEWAVVVARDGTVCAIAYSGSDVGDQWPASRAVAAEKAFTANGLSLPKFATSTANLYAGAQPGGLLYGMTNTNPPNPELLYQGDAKKYGTEGDPIIGKSAGGVVVFAGGLPLYDESGVIGGLGLSGDTSCADHNVAWRVRHKLGLDKVPGGVTDQNNDAIIYDIGLDGSSSSGFGHPECGGKEADIAEDIGASAEDASPFQNAAAAAKGKKPEHHAKDDSILPDVLR